MIFEQALNPALDDTGAPLSFATWSFTNFATGTAAEVFLDEGLKLPGRTSVTADTDGVFPQIFLRDDIRYNATLTDRYNRTIEQLYNIAEDSLTETPGSSARRLRVLRQLQTSIARSRSKFPVVAATVPTIGSPTSATGIASGTTWELAPSNNHSSKYTFTGGEWGPVGPTFPNDRLWKGTSLYLGDGTTALTNPGYYGSVRFQCEAPVLELYVQCAQDTSQGGIRLKVDGEYVVAGAAWSQDPVNGAIRFIKITWGAGTAAERALRHYELEFDSAGGFLGIRTEPIYQPNPWPVSESLRVIQHGDSQVATVVDTTSPRTSITGGTYTTIRHLIGQSDFWVSGVGGTGWFAPSSPKNKSWANDRVEIDIANRTPDIVIDHMGGNDEGVVTAGTVTQAQYEAAVTTWLETVIRKNPNVVIFMFSPVITGVPPVAGHLTITAAKRAAAAKFPKNVVFIDWSVQYPIFGTGRQGSTTGTGNRDWVVGSDSAHFTTEGCRLIGDAMVNAIAGAIPTLITRNQ